MLSLCHKAKGNTEIINSKIFWKNDSESDFLDKNDSKLDILNENDPKSDFLDKKLLKIGRFGGQKIQNLTFWIGKDSKSYFVWKMT